MERREYRMTKADHEKLLRASRPVPYLVFGGRGPPAPQESANRFWRALGELMGFQWESVQPAAGESERCFTAVPLPDAEERET